MDSFESLPLVGLRGILTGRGNEVNTSGKSALRTALVAPTESALREYTNLFRVGLRAFNRALCQNLNP